jgi:hypothetical protein
MIERLIVAVIVIAAVLQVLRTLLPFRARVGFARRLSGRVPDRLIVWFAGQSACESCGGRAAPPVQRRK